MKFVTTFEFKNRNFSPDLDLTGAFLHIFDCVDVCEINDIVDRHGKPAIVCSDHMSLEHTLPPGVLGIFLPLFAAHEARKWTWDDVFDIELQSQATFSFMANKKTLSRSLCVRLVEIFGFRHYLYTWSGLGRQTDMSVILQELLDLREHAPITAHQRCQLLAPIDMVENFVGNKTRKDNNVGFGYDGNRRSWDQGLGDMFQRSVVALITESYVTQPAAVFTEKTVYAMLGCNFPIWIGGYQQARFWKEFGFDIFDDVIDHSYQGYDTLIERCWYAFERNRKILTDIDHARSLREKHQARLQANRELVLDHQLDKYIDQQVAHMPDHYRSHVQTVVESFRQEFGNWHRRYRTPSTS